MKKHPKHCPICTGLVETGRTTFTVDLSTGVVVIRNIPAAVCSQCGEEWIDDATMQAVEKITLRAQQQNTQLEMVSMA
jgi:YgiT-type zinc finger domain-containing protein